MNGREQSVDGPELRPQDLTSAEVEASSWRAELRRQAILHCGVACGLYGLSSLGPWDPEAQSPVPIWWLFEILRTLRPAFAILAALGLFCALLYRRSAMLTLTSLSVAVATLLPLFAFSWPRDPEKQHLRVVSANLLFINREAPAMIRALKELQPDVILIQELSRFWKDTMSAELGADYPHALWAPRDDAFGAAILSKRPFLESEIRSLGANALPMPRVTIKLDGGSSVCIYNCHLLPPRTLSYTAEQRASLLELLEQLRIEEGPVILGGDFNATEHSAVHKAILSEGFFDAFEQAGSGRGSTWPARGLSAFLPGIRLDHIYLRGLRASSFRVGEAGGSDHRSLLVTLVD